MPKISFFSFSKTRSIFPKSVGAIPIPFLFFYFIKEYFPNETIDSRRKETSCARIVRLSLKIFKTRDIKKKNLSTFETNTDYRRTCKRGKTSSSLETKRRCTRLLDYYFAPWKEHEGSAISCNSRCCSRGQLRRNVTAQYYSTKLARCIRTMGPNYVRYRLH